MSNAPEPEFDLDLHFLPAWAKRPPEENRYADFARERERPDRPRDRRDRPPRRRDQAEARGPGGPPPERPPRRPFREGRLPRDQQARGERRPPRDQPAPPPLPLPEISLVFVPDDKGVESLARQIKMTGRAYPLFAIAQMVLQKPERHSVTFSVRRRPDGSVAQPLFVCALDDTLWLAEDAAVQHVLERHFTTFYQPERTQAEPPKGTYTFVAQCGLSGVVLGPPNHHDYQNQLRKVHAEKFATMPFEAFKARVKIVRDEAVVKKWVEEQSWKTEYVCLNVPEPRRLPNREEVERHFREVHLASIIKSVETWRLGGGACRNLRDPGLRRLVRHEWEHLKRFPLQVATVLSQQFAARGLQFFKTNKTVTHVAVSRPHYLDVETTPVSENVKRIVGFISANAKCTHQQLLDALAPQPAGATEPGPERANIIADLHWLVHQGHVIEFANGVLELARKPPPKPPAKPAEAPPLREDATAAPPPADEPAVAPVAAATVPAEPAAEPASDLAGGTGAEVPRASAEPQPTA